MSETPETESTAGPRRSRRWAIPTAAAAVGGLVLAGSVYALTDGGADEQSAPGPTGTASETGSPPTDGDGGDGGDDPAADPDDETLDPMLLECMAPEGGPGAGDGDGDGSIPDADIDVQVDAIADIVEEERGLAGVDELDVEFVTLDEVQERAVELNAEEADPEEAAEDARILAALGAVEPGIDLVEAQLDALDAGVSGFYNTETEELVIGSTSMDALGAVTTSHELVHAMADASFELPSVESIDESAGADAGLAALSAIEGDASLYSQRFALNHLPFNELLGLDATAAEADAALDELPYVIGRSLLFPYEEGLMFSCAVFLDGGWDAIDRTYDDPPTTTAQVLFPERYLAGEEAVDVRDPEGPAGWDVLESDTFGAADLLFLLEAPGDDESAALPDPVDRVAAWAGGELTAWTDGDATAVAVMLADRGGTTPLCETVTDFYAAAYPGAERSADDGGTTFEGPEQAAVVR
ncbi:MAG: hypothetical protein ACOC96_07050, partial [Actinomycetota bacterium]